ncbi:hypothetical protein HPB47_016074 [Ixodes persulcatus]|uniref:Uncharacterized protein n=1 Tax=Ixodes persulcatus TaxID=34615 RepID=A0AC60QRU0_IXOPE|nr:hypothetical protein HPB47_016074 [Ixodes persulcatus]
MASARTQTSPGDLQVSSESPSKPTGTVPTAQCPKPREGAGPPASTPEQGMAPPASVLPRGLGQPPSTTAPRKPGETSRQLAPKGQLMASPEEPMEKCGLRSDDEAILSGSESSLAAPTTSSATSSFRDEEEERHTARCEGQKRKKGGTWRPRWQQSNAAELEGRRFFISESQTQTFIVDPDLHHRGRPATQRRSPQPGRPSQRQTTKRTAFIKLLLMAAGVVWFLGVFASRGTVKGHLLSKIITEAIILCHAAPQLTLAHIKPNSFEKMRVNLAFQLFTTNVLRGLLVFQAAIEKQHGDSTATGHFVELIRDLIAAMSSRTPTRSLKRSSEQLQFLQAVLNYLDEWEVHAQGRGFLSKSTAQGLRVTLTSMQKLLEYLIEKVVCTFLITSRLSQDCVERLFGIIRQFSSSNEHPGPSQFLIIANALQFYSLARSQRKGTQHRLS